MPKRGKEAVVAINHASTEVNAEIAAGGLQKVLEYLTGVPAWYLATTEGDQPHVRPFSFAAEHEGRIWFCTATTKDVYRELAANPKFERTAWKSGSGWLIMRGEADLVDQATPEIRQAGYEHMLDLGEYHSGPDAPELTFFSTLRAEAWICDIDGTKTRVEL